MVLLKLKLSCVLLWLIFAMFLVGWNWARSPVVFSSCYNAETSLSRATALFKWVQDEKKWITDNCSHFFRHLSGTVCVTSESFGEMSSISSGFKGHSSSGQRRNTGLTHGSFFRKDLIIKLQEVMMYWIKTSVISFCFSTIEHTWLHSLLFEAGNVAADITCVCLPGFLLLD